MRRFARCGKSFQDSMVARQSDRSAPVLPLGTKRYFACITDSKGEKHASQESILRAADQLSRPGLRCDRAHFADHSLARIVLATLADKGRRFANENQQLPALLVERRHALRDHLAVAKQSTSSAAFVATESVPLLICEKGSRALEASRSREASRFVTDSLPESVPLSEEEIRVVSIWLDSIMNDRRK